MNQLKYIQRSFLTLLLLTLLCTSVRAQKTDTKTENVIIITMDGLRWQELFGGAVDPMVGNPDRTSETNRIEASNRSLIQISDPTRLSRTSYASSC